jgi:hypothetical protein
MIMKNKKAMFFTVLVISILLIFVISYSFVSISKDRKAINRRIETMNNFVFSTEKDLPRQLYISGFRIIFLIEKDILETGDYIGDLNATIEELFYNGSMNGNNQELMKGANFSGMQEFVDNKASKINAEVYLSEPVLKVTQEDPWNIKFSLNISMLVVDNANLSSWNKTLEVNSYIPIENFEDPVYIVETNNVITNKISRTSYYPFVEGSDISNLSDHLVNSSYVSSVLAPSFLQRLEGNFGSSDNGIESLVYLPSLSSQGMPIEDKCIVDYIYFSSQNPSPLYMTTGMQGWFKLDEPHLDVYQVENISYVV